MHSFSYKRGCMTGSASGLLCGCTLFEPQRIPSSLMAMVPATDHSCAAACVPVFTPCPHPFVFVTGWTRAGDNRGGLQCYFISNTHIVTSLHLSPSFYSWVFMCLLKCTIGWS